MVFGSWCAAGSESQEKQPIVWDVLANEDGSLLLISNGVLDKKPYCMDYIGNEICWESSYIRYWLQNEFLPAAFSEEELQHLKPTETVEGSRKDRVFLFSLEEAERYFWESDRLRACGSEWMLKSTWHAGSSSYFHVVDEKGSIYSHSPYEEGVRPALWLSERKTEDFDLEG